MMTNRGKSRQTSKGRAGNTRLSQKRNPSWVDRFVNLLIYKEPPQPVFEAGFGDRAAYGVESVTTIRKPNNKKSQPNVRIEEVNLSRSGYLSINQASEYCGLTPETLRRLCKERMLHAQKVSGRWFISVKSLSTHFPRAYAG